ncbi:MAG TPA: acyl-CoA dehydrogenase family protein [Polyangiaceae bacterium]|jgi:alkylation response protein AidB-like acyl-CoA dehydrogenase
MTTVTLEEQESIRQAARGFVRERAPVSHLRALRDDDDPLGFSLDLWLDMGKLGYPGMALPEAHGGGGLGLAELGVVAEELGRNLVPTPMLSSVLGAGAVALAGTEALQQTVLSGVSVGDRVVSLAHDEGKRFSPYAIATRAERRGGKFAVTGEKSFVLDGFVAGSFIVVARTSGAPGDRDGLTLLHVLADDPGITTTRLTLVDSRNVARVKLEGVEATEVDVVGAVDRGAEVLDDILDRGAAVLAAEMLGGMQECFDRTVAYLKTRKQFGVYIGSFQALKHRAAWLFSEVELTRSLVAEALRALDAGRSDAPQLASAAKARASETYVLVTNEAVQMHGGIGVTDEADIGFYLKRARVAAETLGSARYHRDRFARLKGY